MSISGGGGIFVFIYAKFYYKDVVFVRSCSQFQDTALSSATVASTPGVRKDVRKKCLFLIACSYYHNMKIFKIRTIIWEEV